MRDISSYDDFIGEGGPKYTTELVDISLIKAGDTVVVDGDLKTVGSKDIKTGGFYGTTLFGDSYRSGSRKVQRAILGHFVPGKK